MKVEHDKTYIEKYGMKLELGIAKETRPAWERRFILEDGTKLTLEEAKELRDSGKVGEGAIARIVWEQVDKTVTVHQPEICKLYDDEHHKNGLPVYLFGTTDGPIIAGLETHDGSDWVTFWDPCHVKYSPNGQIDLVPIFGVARKMDMHVSAVKQRTVPGELFGEVYLQFAMQNRQSAYELRPKSALASTEELDNNEEAPSLEVE